MFKKWLFPAFVAAMLSACANEPTATAHQPQNLPANSAGQPAPDTVSLQGSSGSKGKVSAPNSQSAGSKNEAVSKLKAEALQETDYLGRVKSSLITLQEEFNKSQGKVKGQGKVSVFVDENFILLLKNETGSDVFESKVNLKNLSWENGGMELIPNTKPGDFPGFRIHKRAGKPGVEIFKNGKLEKEQDFLEIFLAERSNVERAVPAVVQALMVAQGKS